jgi:hypothetical protein
MAATDFTFLASKISKEETSEAFLSEADTG